MARLILSGSVSRCYLPTFLLLLSTLISMASAVDVGQTVGQVGQTIGNGAKGLAVIFANSSGPTNYVMAILLIVIGILFVFFGYRLFRIVMFFTGALFFGAIAYLILVNVEPSTGYAIGSLSREAFYLIIMIVAGILGGIFGWFLWNVAISILGALGGACLAFFIQGLKTGGLLPYPTGFAIFLVLMSIIGAIAAIFFERFIIILASAIAGSLAAFTGIDFFAQTGFYQLLQSWMNFAAGGTISYQLTNQLIGMLVGSAVFALVGFLLQYKLWDPLRFGPNAIRGSKKYRQ
ncbi:hypothetical protein HDU93_001715 [Gonapodya sp. JEL0774]|nr:hypothetical protein HDU93_001715 [Gonapodya sp. JEL0774]